MTQFVEGKAPRGAVTQEGAPKLLPRHLAFVDEYMKDRNATQAYIRAGYSAKAANVNAARLIANDSVSAEIAKRVEEYSRTAGLKVVDLLEQGKRLVFADIRKLFDEQGKLLHPTQWPDDVAAAVAGMDLVEEWGKGEDGKPEQVGWTKKVKMIDKAGPLFKLLDYLIGAPGAPATTTNVTNNIQVNAEQAILELDALIPE